MLDVLVVFILKLLRRKFPSLFFEVSKIDRGETLNSTLTSLFPMGTIELNEGDRPTWNCVPVWPPDLFAFAATIVQKMGFYAETRYSGNGVDQHSFYNSEYRSGVKECAEYWMEKLLPPSRVDDIWDVLMLEVEVPLVNLSAKSKDALIELLAIADSASAGIGVDVLVTEQINVCALANARFFAPEGFVVTPKSICHLIPPEIISVLPKTLTPQVGCNLRTLSHHLALLPGALEVATKWNVVGDIWFSRAPIFNFLLVPFPFEIRGNPFEVLRRIDDGVGESAFFKSRMSYVDGAGFDDQISQLIASMLEESERKGDKVNAVIFPEAALTRSSADAIARFLVSSTSVELFVCGVLEDSRNYASSYLFKNGELRRFDQAKHHRWKLDRYQYANYGLKFPDGVKYLWEDIDISSREVNVFTFRPGAVFASLVCEDLARVDPVQTVLRAIGPSLVLALLQDGAQREFRWSARSSASLADDPGSSVLTLTSLGMVEKNLSVFGSEGGRKIAFWRDKNKSVEIDIEAGCFGVLLQVETKDESQITLDGRSDESTAISIEYVKHFSVGCGAKSPDFFSYPTKGKL